MSDDSIITNILPEYNSTDSTDSIVSNEILPYNKFNNVFESYESVDKPIERLKQPINKVKLSKLNNMKITYEADWIKVFIMIAFMLIISFVLMYVSQSHCKID